MGKFYSPSPSSSPKKTDHTCLRQYGRPDFTSISCFWVEEIFCGGIARAPFTGLLLYEFSLTMSLGNSRIQPCIQCILSL
jgi:hypothetical protein